MNRKIPIEDLLLCTMQVLGRGPVPEARVHELLSASPKHLDAYNMCDGTRTISQIAKDAKLDQGNLSKSVARWIQNGIVFWIGSGKDARILHLYPVPRITKGSKKT